MRLPTPRLRVLGLLAGLGVVAAIALPGAAAASGAPTVASAASHGTIKGFSTGDFAFLDALSVPHLNLVQASIGQSAAGVSNSSLQTTDTLGQDLFTSTTAATGNAYGRGAGVSLNLGQADDTVPQVQLANAEAISPPRNSAATQDLSSLSLSHAASVDVQPDSAVANTTSAANFCVLGKPLSEGTSTIANADVMPAAGSVAVASTASVLRSDSTEELAPNGAGALGLSSVATLDASGFTLFDGIPGAAITVKVINPLVLRAFAGGVSGSAHVTFGGSDGQKDVLAISAGSHTVKLTAEQVFGSGGLVIPVGTQSLHLLNITIGGKPTVSTASNGTTASAVADLVTVQIINHQGPTSTTIGGPLGPILSPVLDPVVQALDNVAGQIQHQVEQLGLKKGIDLRLGHFEANAQVPSGGITCGLPVTKSTNKDPVAPGDHFTITIRADNPYDCVARQVRVHDSITATDGVTWTVDATHPTADTVTDHDVVWNDIGSIQPGGHRDVHVDIAIDPDSAAGKMSDTAKVTASCGVGRGPGGSTITLAGDFTLHAPQVNPQISSGDGTLPNTGLAPMLPIGGGILLATGLGIAVIRRRVA